MAEKKHRIEYIDLAKGFCIFLVVAVHVFKDCGILFPFNSLLTKIRMPLYYVLSGLFFKQYEGFDGFLKRKINKLFIPFAFFYLIFSIPYMTLKFHAQGTPLLTCLTDAFLGLYNRDFTNGKTWFLFSLFNTSILFYLIFIASQKIKSHTVTILILLSLIVGFCGLYLGYQRIWIPAYLDTSLSAVPLYCFGYLLNKHSNILRDSKWDKYLPIIIIGIIISLSFISGRCTFSNNHYSVRPLWLFPSCCLGALSIILLAKYIKRIPWFTYIGRYSIILLLFHEPIYINVIKLVKLTGASGYLLGIASFLITMVILTVIISPVIKYLPHVTAQKDVIKV